MKVDTVSFVVAVKLQGYDNVKKNVDLKHKKTYFGCKINRFFNIKLT